MAKGLGARATGQQAAAMKPPLQSRIIAPMPPHPEISLNAPSVFILTKPSCGLVHCIIILFHWFGHTVLFCSIVRSKESTHTDWAVCVCVMADGVPTCSPLKSLFLSHQIYPTATVLWKSSWPRTRDFFVSMWIMYSIAFSHEVVAFKRLMSFLVQTKTSLHTLVAWSHSKVPWLESSMYLQHITQVWELFMNTFTLPGILTFQLPSSPLIQLSCSHESPCRFLPVHTWHSFQHHMQTSENKLHSILLVSPSQCIFHFCVWEGISSTLLASMGKKTVWSIVCLA